MGYCSELERCREKVARIKARHVFQRPFKRLCSNRKHAERRHATSCGCTTIGSHSQSAALTLGTRKNCTGRRTSQSQLDCIIQPGVARCGLPWECPQTRINSARVESLERSTTRDRGRNRDGRVRFNPVGVDAFFRASPRVAAQTRQPWADLIESRWDSSPPGNANTLHQHIRREE